MTKDELQRALECAERCRDIDGLYWWGDVVDSLKAALEAKDEPDAFRLKSETVDYQVTCYSKEQADIYINDMGWQLVEVLYTTPPQRTWNELTLAEAKEAYAQHAKYQIEDMGASGWVDFAAAIEAKLREKNT